MTPGFQRRYLPRRARALPGVRVIASLIALLRRFSTASDNPVAGCRPLIKEVLHASGRRLRM
jgi:hypothetical protein